MADKYLTLAEIAAALRISHETARRAVLDGTLEGFQVRGPNSAWRVESRSYRSFLAKSRNRGDAAQAQQDDNHDIITK